MTKITTNNAILKDKGINFVDMHHHSTVSDGIRSPKFIAKVFMGKGMGVCIADHNRIKGSVYLANLAKKKKIFTIPCVEITSKEGKDLLAYFYSVNEMISFWEKEIKERIRPNALFNFNRTTMGLVDIVDKIEAYNGVVVLPHPLAMNPKRSCHLLKDNSLLKRIKAIESHNFGVGKYWRTTKLAGKFKKPLTAGSDSHIISLFNALTGSREFEADAFLDSIVKGKNIIYYKNNHQLWRLLEQWVIFKKNMHMVAPENG
jgi:predicted metal-dependent phosphoesterase TrpH